MDTDWSTTSVRSETQESDSSSHEIPRIDRQELEQILQSIDDITHRSKDFRISKPLRKELNDVIESILAYKCKLTSIYNQSINMCPQTKNPPSRTELIKNSNILMDKTVKEMMRYTDVLALIYNEIADKMLSRICDTIKRISSDHCHNMMPLMLLLNNVEYADSFIIMLNKSISDARKTIYESSNNPLFDENCCVDIKDDNCDDCINKTCEEQITTVIRATAQLTLDNDIVTKLFTTNEQKKSYIERLKDDMDNNKLYYKKRMDIIEEILQHAANATIDGKTGRDAFDAMYNDSDTFIKLKSTKNVKTGDYNEYDDIPFGNIDSDFNEKMHYTNNNQEFKNLKKHIFQKIKNPLNINMNTLNNLYVTVPCIIHSKTLSKCKAVLVIKSFIRLHKYFSSYIIYKSVGKMLQQDSKVTSTISDKEFITFILKEPLDAGEKETIEKNMLFKIIRKLYDDQFRQLLVG